MVWWIVGGVVLFALVLLAVVAGGTVGRAAGMRRAMGTAQRRQADAEALRERMAEMQESLAALATRAEVTQERVAAIQAARADRPDSGQVAANRTIAGALGRRPPPRGRPSRLDHR
jgi:uncharacterized protein YlxW (UPF0749 family)